jgi:hypothetical protein
MGLEGGSAFRGVGSCGLKWFWLVSAGVDRLKTAMDTHVLGGIDLPLQAQQAMVYTFCG